MKINVKAWIVIAELAGFMLVTLVVWLDELADLPNALFGAPLSSARPQEGWLETSIVITACAGVVLSTIWLFRRIRELESYIVVCAWCRRVKVNDRWMAFEQYMNEKAHTMTSHGICEDCAEKQLQAARHRAAASSN